MNEGVLAKSVDSSRRFSFFFSFFFCISGPPFWNTTGPHTQAVPVCKNVPAGSTAAGLFLFFCVLFLLWQPKKKKRKIQTSLTGVALCAAAAVLKNDHFFLFFLFYFLYIYFFQFHFYFHFHFLVTLARHPKRVAAGFFLYKKKTTLLPGFFSIFYRVFFISARTDRNKKNSK